MNLFIIQKHFQYKPEQFPTGNEISVDCDYAWSKIS